MNYISTEEASKKWDIGQRRVQYFCAHGMVPGAKRIGRQWVIPADAKRPIDGRTRQGKAKESESYHFPVFIFTPCYADPSDLSESEQKLLQAQVLRLEGKYAKSIEICQEILSGYTSPYLAAGVHLTIGYDSILLGITSQYRRALAALDKILEAGTQHDEDVRLMRASLFTCGNLDCKPIFAIDAEKLSIEAVTYHKYLLLIAFFTTGAAEGKIAFRYFNSDIPQLERSGITPAIYSFHCLLGSMNSPENSLQDREEHIRAAVDLAIENNWVPNLCRYYTVSSGLIDKCLEIHGQEYVAKLKRAFQTTIRGWHVVHASEIGNDEIQQYSSEQLEMLLLVMYGYSDSTIATVKCMAEEEVGRAIAELCAIAGVGTKADLEEYARNIMPQS